MYPYNYNTFNYQDSIYTPAKENDERLVGGFIGPLLLGGVAGYAIGQNNNYNNRPYFFYTQPRPFYNPMYYNPYYYPYYRR